MTCLLTCSLLTWPLAPVRCVSSYLICCMSCKTTTASSCRWQQAVAPNIACKPASPAPGTTNSAPKRPSSKAPPSALSSSVLTCSKPALQTPLKKCVSCKAKTMSNASYSLPMTRPCPKTTTRVCTCGFKTAGRATKSRSWPKPGPRTQRTPRYSPSCLRSTRVTSATPSSR